jgi:hypothetical protein
MSTSTTAPVRTPNQLLGLLFGAVYLLVGLVGFAITSGIGFAATQGHNLIFFEVNPLHNIVHLGVGAALALAGWRGPGLAKAVNTLVGGVYLLVGVVGLFLIDSAANILALNHPDNVLHLASAAVLLGIGLTRR